MQYLLFACLIVAVLCWVMAAINSVATHNHVKPGMRLRMMMDFAVWWSPDSASFYLEEKGVAHFKQARTWIFRFLGLVIIMMAIILLLSLQAPTP